MAFLLSLQTPPLDQPARYEVQVEAGVAYQLRNTASRPGDSTRFSYRDLLGTGPYGAGRINIITNPDGNHGWRFAYIPLRIEGSGKLGQQTTFSGSTFAGDVNTRGFYLFDGYRITYWNRWHTPGNLSVRAGYTLGLRVASVALKQGPIAQSYSNFGPVPALHLDAEYSLNTRWSVGLDYDGILAPAGGLTDLGFQLKSKITQRDAIYLGARVLDGGFDGDTAYNFFTGVSFTVGYEKKL